MSEYRVPGAPAQPMTPHATIFQNGKPTAIAEKPGRSVAHVIVR